MSEWDAFPRADLKGPGAPKTGPGGFPRSAPDPWEEFPRAEQASAPTRLLGHVNKAIGGVLSPITDPIKAGTGIDLPELARQQGVAISDQPAETYPERTAEGIGIAASTLLPGGAITGLARRGAGAIGSVAGEAGDIARPWLQKAADYVADPFVRTPLRTVGLEMGAAGLMGAGGKAGEEAAPQLGVSPETGRMIGELAGGGVAMVPGLAMTSADRVLQWVPGVGIVYRGGRKAFTPFTAKGAWSRASDRMRTASGRPEEDAAALNDPSLSGMTPAQRTGNPRLMAIERAVRDEDPQLDEALAKQTEDAIDAVKQGYQGIAEGGEAFDTVQFLKQQRQALNDAIDGQLAAAEARAAQRVESIDPNMSETQASEIYREELENALRASQRQTQKAWGDVPKEIPAPTTNARRAYQELKESLPSAKQKHLPEEARRYLDPESNARFTDEESAKELHGLYSELRKEARDAAAGSGSAPPNPERARNADILAEAVLADLNSVEAVSPSLRAALDATRIQKEKFSQGVVGDILGRKRTGSQGVPAGQTLQKGLGQGGARGAVTADELRRAVGDSPRAEEAAQEYLSRRFMQEATTDGQLDPRKAQRFIQKNDEMLDRFPGLKAQFRAAAEEGATARQMQDEVTAGRREAEQTPAARMAEAQRGREFEAIIEKNQDPTQAARALRREAAQDPTGKAARGLKASATEYLIGRGEDMNVQRLRDKLSDPKVRGAAKEILDPDDFQRINTTIKAIDQMRESIKASGGTVIDDTPTVLLDTAARISGAIGGERLRAGQGGAGVGLQAAQIGSSRARQFMRWLTRDKAKQLIIDAQTDPDLFKALLTDPDRVFSRDNPLQRKLMAWLAANTGMQFREDEEGEPRTDDRQSRAAPQRGEAQAAVQPRSGEDVDPKVVRRFETLQARLGKSLPVKSGYRSPEKNKAVGGAEQSRHMEGDALDIDVSDLQPKERLKLIREASRLGFTGIGVYDSTIHLDMGDKRAWGPSHGRESVPHWAEATVRGHLKGSFAPQ